MLGQRAFVRAVSAQIGDAVRAHAQDEDSRKGAHLQPILELVARIDLGDPHVVLVPLGRDSVGRGSKRPEKLGDQFVHGLLSPGGAAVRDQHADLGRREPHHTLDVELVDRSQQLLDRGLGHGRRSY